MTKILQIDSSITGEDSVTRKLTARLASSLAKQSGGSVVTRDLAKNDLPFLDGARFAANGTAAEDRTAEQADLAVIADTLIAELQAADTIVIGVPVYNFFVPSTLKAWFDLVARKGTTFTYGENGVEGHLTGKKVYLIYASGGMGVGSEIDHMTPWLRLILGFIGLDDVEIIAANGRAGPDEANNVPAAEALVDAVTA